MKSINMFILAAATLFMILSFVLSFWPLAPLSIALFVLYGHTALGISAGLFFDLVFGAPQGIMAMVHFPFLLFAVVCVGLRILAIRFLLPSGDLDAL